MTEFCEIDSRVEADRVEIAVRGEIDIETSVELGACLQEHIGAGRSTLQISLRGVTFIDSTGIGVLVRAYKAIGDDGRMTLVDVPDRVARTFRLVGLDTFIDMTELTSD